MADLIASCQTAAAEVLDDGESVVAAANAHLTSGFKDLIGQAAGRSMMVPDQLVLACTQRRVLLFSTDVVSGRRPRRLVGAAELGQQISSATIVPGKRAGIGKVRVQVTLLDDLLLLDAKRADAEQLVEAINAAHHSITASADVGAAFGQAPRPAPGPTKPLFDPTLLFSSDPIAPAAAGIVRASPTVQSQLGRGQNLHLHLYAGAAMLGAGVIYALSVGMPVAMMIIDVILVVQLVRGRQSAARWTQIRAVATIALLLWATTTTAGDDRPAYAAAAATVALLIVLIGQPSKVRLGVGITWFVVAAVAVWVVDNETERFGTLAVGECAADPGVAGIGGELIEVSNAALADCFAPHGIEVIAHLPVTERPLPGESALTGRASAECPARLEAYTGVPHGQSMLDIGWIIPLQGGIGSGTPQILCFAMRLDGTDLVASVFERGDEYPLPCFDDAGSTTSCEGEHAEELLSFMVNPSARGAAYPGAQALDGWAKAACTEVFTSVTGAGVEKSAYALVWLVPSIDEWQAGDRAGSCHVGKADGTMATGSIRG